MRLSITTVETFRLYRDTGDWMTLDDLESTIRKDAEPNDNMLRGKAFHAILERPDDCRREAHYDADGWTFDAEGIDQVVGLLPDGRVCEVKSTVDVDGITLSGVADALHALDVYEAKCTGRIDTEKYFDSFQWRAYLKMFDAERVIYLLAQYYEKGGVVTLPNVLPLPLYRYPNLDDDVKRLTNECAEFIILRGLEHYVQDKQEEAA